MVIPLNTSPVGLVLGVLERLAGFTTAAIPPPRRAILAAPVMAPGDVSYNLVSCQRLRLRITIP